MITPVRAFNPINFKSNYFEPSYFSALRRATADTFTKSSLKQEIYDEKLKTHPNVAFLYDPTTTTDTKLEQLKNHSEIVSASELAEKYQIDPEFLTLATFFDFESFKNTNKKKELYLDMSLEVNQKNLQRIIENKNNLMSKNEFKKMYRVGLNEFTSLLESGRLCLFDLYSKEDNELIPSSLLYITDEVINTTLSNVQQVGKTSPYFKKLALCNNKPVYANILSLSQLGFGKPMDLYKLVAQNVLAGSIKTDENTSKKIVLVNLNDKNNEKILKDLREKTCVEISSADNRFGLSELELRNAFYDGQLKCHTQAVFVGDMEKIFIDMNDPNNIDSLNKILFEKELLYGLSPKNFYRPETSQRIKLAWYFAPNTRKIANELAKDDEIISSIIDRREQNDFLLENDYSFNTPLYKEYSINYLDRIHLKSYYQKIWELAGTEEYTQALKKADETLKTISQTNINTIKDDNLRRFISSTKNTSKRDFLTYS